MSQSHTEQFIEVDVPVRVAYNQWTNFGEFPKFMGGVKNVTRQAADKIHFEVAIGPKTLEYDAKIVDQKQDQLVSWRAIDGKDNAGIVTFNPLSATKTRVGLRMNYETEGLLENIGDALGFVDRQAKSDLHSFKEYVEDRDQAKVAWRDES